LQIGDALVKLKFPFGGFLDGISMWSPSRRSGSCKIIGQAVTVKMVGSSDKGSPSPSQHFVDCNQSGKIMYIQQPKGLYSACWGGLMSTRAKYLGAQGVLIDGRIRDVGEHIEMQFPVCGPNGICMTHED
jgi:regulator of RNase E activity RraA